MERKTKPNPISKKKKKKRLIVKPRRPYVSLKATKLKKFKGNHHKILKHSLQLLIDNLLPLAVRSYSNDPKQGSAYAVTKIISEIRETIQQLEAAIDGDKILDAVSREIATILRMSIVRMASHITLIKEGLPLKVKDSATRREIGLLLEDILKEYESNMTEVVSNIELRVANTVKEIIKGSPKVRRKTKKKKP